PSPDEIARRSPWIRKVLRPATAGGPQQLLAAVSRGVTIPSKTPPRVGWHTIERFAMLPLAKKEMLNQLKTVRGHVDGIIGMVEDEVYCVDLMKQVSAAQASLERVNRLILKNHLETCFSEAVSDGRAQPAIAELLDAVKFNPVLTGADASLG